jgi:Fusaric acid resistance protein-like
MSRWRPSLGSLQPGMVRPGLVTRQQVFLAAKTAIAAGLAWVAALAADPHSRPYFAPLAVLLVIQPTVYHSLSRAFQRVAGVVVGVAAALAVSHFMAPSAWSIGIIIFAGLLLGWTARMGSQGAVQVPVSALLVFLVGRATPGYGGERIADTLIGAGVAVIAVLLSPSAPGPDAVMAKALAPLHRCTEILRAVSAGIGSPWTPDQAASWRLDANTLIASFATARREHQGDRLSTRWNARARRERAALGRADEALLSGERIAIATRSMARALVDGSGHARPMPTLSAMLAKTASATEAYTAWVASAGAPADRRLLAKAVHAADETLGSALARVQQRWGSDPAQWLTFGMTLAMSQRILAEVGRPLDPAEREPA